MPYDGIDPFYVSYVRALSCRKCGREHPAELIHLCDFCFSPLIRGLDEAI